MAGVAWTEEELCKLTKLWDSTLTAEEVAEYLPGRSATSIRVKAKRLKLRHTPEQFSKILSKKTSGVNNGMYGKEGSLRGVEFTDQHRRRLSIAAKAGYASGSRKPMKGKDNPRYGKPGTMKGKTQSEKAKQILSQAKKRWWSNRSDAYKKSHLKKMRKGWVKWSEASGPTQIEIIVEGWLSTMGVEYSTQKLLHFFIVDFIVGNCVIETHGDYWHGNPKHYLTLDSTQRKNKRRDDAKRTLLTKKGYCLLELWEDNILNNPEATRQQLEEFLAGGER